MNLNKNYIEITLFLQLNKYSFFYFLIYFLLYLFISTFSLSEIQIQRLMREEFFSNKIQEHGTSIDSQSLPNLFENMNSLDANTIADMFRSLQVFIF